MVTALIIAAAAIFIFLRVERIALRVLADKEPKAPPKAEPIPAGLWLLANMQSDGWARDDALRKMYELYEEFGGDWNRVAQAFQTKE